MEILTQNQPEQTHRLIILTDMENEPDDSQDLVKLLMYSNEIDIEGLIAVTSRPLMNDVFPESIVDRVKAYGVIRDNLKLHASGWPTENQVLSTIATGPVDDGSSRHIRKWEPGWGPHMCKWGMDVVGDGHNTDGSDLIISSVDKDDSRPIHIVANAGTNTLAQALWDVQKSRSQTELKQFIAKIRVYDNQSQDNAGAWICHTFPDIHYKRSNIQSRTLYGPRLGAGPQPWAPLTQWQWAEKHIRTRHGILGALYPQRMWENGRFQYMDGGGVTGWIGLVNKGLFDPEEITWGGWGGRFSWEKTYVPAFMRDIAPLEETYKPFQMYPEAADEWADGPYMYVNTWGVHEKDVCAPVWRWRTAYTNDFQARMDWCVADYAHANHHPIAAFYDDPSRTIVRALAEPGETVALDASASMDPDGDHLTFKWYLYPEAGTYKHAIHVTDSDQSIARLQIPRDTQGPQIHIILEVTDQNPIVNLTAYRRIVIDIE
jgi:hypothetical protein